MGSREEGPGRDRGASSCRSAVPRVGLLLVWLALVSGCNQTRDPASLAPFVASSDILVEEMLALAAVRKDDVVYDLGSGDGRIVIAAARNWGARGVGFELDADLVRRSRENARRAGVAHLVEFRQQDILTVDLSAATVVTIYLSRDANLKLRPRLLSQLRPGARVVSHEFDMGDWAPTNLRQLPDESGLPRTIYLWTIPPR
ncbi:MAG: cyclopropane-fatty-acyl-phospholipid synthase family protein [Candidatus Methylomirabilales bacterium]